jgi:hypothetical protein
MVDVTVATDAPAEAVAELHEHVNAHSPVWDTLASPVRIASKLIVTPA